MLIRPNWRDPEPYKWLLDPDLNHFIAWEFLRRNPTYQQDIRDFQDEGRAWQQNNPHTDLGLPIGPAQLGGWCRYVQEKWKIFFPFTPGTGGEAVENFVMSDFHRPDLFKPVSLCGRIDGPRVMIPVDLSEPWEVLEKRVMFIVKTFRNQGIANGTVQPRKKRVLAPRKYVEHLRILDAFAGGATLREIGDVLAPEAVNDSDARQRDKRLKAAYEAALKMQGDGYKALLLN
jgi:hypothetical protein